MAVFKWTPRRQRAALLLGQGYSQQRTADQVGVSLRTVQRWAATLDFMLEVDRLTLLTGIAAKAERLRIAMRAVRARVSEESVRTNRDVLEWLKFAQSETDGAKLDLAPLFENLASSPSDGPEEEEDGDSDV